MITPQPGAHTSIGSVKMKSFDSDRFKSVFVYAAWVRDGETCRTVYLNIQLKNFGRRIILR